MRNYSNAISNRPQTQPAFGRIDMVKNNAGGYVFEITPQERLERFLLIGSEGGTYYVGEQKLTTENAESIVKYIKTDGAKVLSTVVTFATEYRAPKADAGLFVLALLATFGDEKTKIASYGAISSVCKTSTHLFTLISNLHNLRGWSRGLRNGVAKFYTEKTPDQIAYQMIKYRNRAGFTHKDVLRLAHPKTSSVEKNALFSWATDGEFSVETAHPLIKAYLGANAADISTSLLVDIIGSGRLPWEAIPTEKLNDASVLKALLNNMPTMALIRNLNRFANAGLTDGNSETTKRIVAELTNAEKVKKSGIHPLTVVNSMLTYSSGKGQMSDKTWKVNQNIVDALSTTYELALKAITPTGKNILVGVDISGSMHHAVGGMHMNAAAIANVLALTILKSEPNAEVIFFDTAIKEADYGRRSSVDEVLKKLRHGGGTDCAQPIVYAANKLASYDAIVILTDNETWAGREHGFEVLASYRRAINPNVKVIEVALVANPSSTFPKDDKNLLRVVGFDASVVDVINNYLA